MKQRLSRFRLVVLIIPFVLAFIGYYLVYSQNPDIEPRYVLTSCLFNSFKIYATAVMVGLDEMNPWLEVARWSGALVTTSMILVVLKHIASGVRLRWKLRRPDTVVVHGDGVQQDTIVRALGKSGVAAKGDISFRPATHVLAFENDGAAIRYIMENEQKLFTNDKAVYFSSSEYEASDYAQSGLTVTNTAVNCARLYWQEHWLQDEKIRKVAIVGFGHYGQQLLEQALLVNVLPWRGPVEYHIYGSDGKTFLSWRPELRHCLTINHSDDVQDSLHFHPSLREMGIDHIQGMDRIIITQDSVDENLLLLNHLIHTGLNGVIHIRCGKKLLKQLQYLPERRMAQGLLTIASFGDEDELFSRDVILHGKLCEAAKNAHITYVTQSSAENIRRKYPSCTRYEGCKEHGPCAGCPHAPATWDDLTPFEKSSNIAAADHAPIKRYLLRQAESKGGVESCHQELCRIEHIRWSRFYYLHNWHYAPQRDDARRLHPSLQPFDELSISEQEKDWWAYETILKEA